MTNLFSSKKAPDPLPPADPQEAAARSDNSRRQRLAKGGTYATLFGNAEPIPAQQPKSTLFGG